ncbi:DUF262 domain-containing protein [Chloroflexota bacterium]
MVEYDKRTFRDLLANLIIKGKNESLFTGSCFQCKYNWEAGKEVQHLAGDIFDNIGQPYFIGSLIYSARPGSLNIEIIAGQQRLTTLVIFYHAVIDYKRAHQKAGKFPARQKPVR